MNGKQAKKLRSLVYEDDFSYRHRHYMWDKPPKIGEKDGEEVLITGSIQSDPKRKLYKQIKKFFKNGSSIKGIQYSLNELQSN